MSGVRDRAGRGGLLANAGAFVVACIAVNGLVFALQWDTASGAASNPLIPPGPVVGAVWVGLFALMGAARWAYRRDTGGAGRAPVMLALTCLAYPFYTRGLSDQTLGYWGAIATLLASLGVAASLWRGSRRAAACVVPVALWTGWVSAVGTVTGQI